LHGEYAVFISIIVILSAIIKELMARYSSIIAKKINSDVLKADSWHHRSDAISSIGVAIGILGARYGFPILDPIFGLFVSFIIIYVGINLIRTSSNFLIGKGPDQDLVKQIEKISNKTEDVIGIHDVSIHDYGTTKILTLHAEINSNLSLDEAHEIADNLEKNIQFKINYSTIIHLDPIELEIEIENGKNIIETILNKQNEIISFHKIQIIHGTRNDHVKMHLIVDKDMSVEDSHELCHRLKSILEKSYKSCDVDIHFEPCGKDCKICTISCQKRII
jgi:divalent metal cation (Fe/Co/Zn/Cd) transporter